MNQAGQDRPVIIENGDELSKEMFATLSLGKGGVGFDMMEPDSDSDDSDGPPTEEDDDDKDTE